MDVPRRWVLLLKLAALIAIPGCAAPGALPQVQQDTATLLAGLRATLPALQNVTPLAVFAAVQLDIQEAAIFGGDIAMALTLAQAATPVQSMADAVVAALTALATLPLTPQLRLVYAAAGVLLRVIQAPLGIQAPALTAAALTPYQARLVLLRAAGGGA